MPLFPTFPAGRTLAVWAMFTGTLWTSGGCTPFRLNQNDEMMRQLDELPPAIKVDASPVGSASMTNRDAQVRQQERNELRHDAPQEPLQQRRGGAETTAPRFQPTPANSSAAPRFQPEQSSTTSPAPQTVAVSPAGSQHQLSPATEAEYLKALDQAGITDPIERAQMLTDLAATEPRHRMMMLRMLKANNSQRQPKGVAARSPGYNRELTPDAVAYESNEEPLPRRRDHQAMVQEDVRDHSSLSKKRNPDVVVRPAINPQDHPEARVSSAGPNQIRQASHLEPEAPRETKTQDLPPKAQDPEQLFRDALAGMEKQLKNGTSDRSAEIAAIRLRLLQALAGQRDAALEPVPNLSPAQQEFLSQQVYALAALLDQQGNALWSRRAALTSEHLQTAADKLSQQAGLLVRNAQLCTEIKSFGNYTTFTKQTFRPNQDVLLYAELDRFKTSNTERGFHTKFHAAYQILDRNGRKIVEKELGLAEEYSPVRRRDYFVSYLVRLPAELQGDEYTLKLMIEDQLGSQVGETSVRLMIEGAAPAVSSASSPLLLPHDRR